MRTDEEAAIRWVALEPELPPLAALTVAAGAVAIAPKPDSDPELASGEKLAPRAVADAWKDAIPRGPVAFTSIPPTMPLIQWPGGPGCLQKNQIG